MVSSPAREDTPAPTPPESGLAAPPILPDITLSPLPLSRSPLAAVYRGWDSAHHCDVFVKVQRATDDTVAIERFRREAMVMGRLRHPHIVALYRFYDTDPAVLVMEYVPGPNLGALVDKDGWLPPTRVADIIEDVAAALDCAHANGIIHRDVKPSNILIPKRRPARLTDFGVAHLDDDTPLTVMGDMLGTIEYASPEQVHGNESPDARSDVYSLAAVAYFALTATPPFRAADNSTQAQLSVMHRQVFAEPPPLRFHREELSPEIEEAVLRGLAKAPDARYPSAGQFAAALRRAVEADLGAPEQRVKAAASRRRGALAGAMAGATLFLIGGIGLWRSGHHALVPPRPISTASAGSGVAQHPPKPLPAPAPVPHPPVTPAPVRQPVQAQVPKPMPVPVPPSVTPPLPKPPPKPSVVALKPKPPIVLPVVTPKLTVKPPAPPHVAVKPPKPGPVVVVKPVVPVKPPHVAIKPPAPPAVVKPPHVAARLPVVKPPLGKTLVATHPPVVTHPPVAKVKPPLRSAGMTPPKPSPGMKPAAAPGKAWLYVYANQNIAPLGRPPRMTSIRPQAIYVDGRLFPHLASGEWEALPAGPHVISFFPSPGSGFSPRTGVHVSLTPGHHLAKQILLPLQMSFAPRPPVTPTVPPAPTPGPKPTMPPKPAQVTAKPAQVTKTPVKVSARPPAAHGIGWLSVEGVRYVNAPGQKPEIVHVPAQVVTVDGQPLAKLANRRWVRLAAGRHVLTFAPRPGLEAGPASLTIQLSPKARLRQQISLPALPPPHLRNE